MEYNRTLVLRHSLGKYEWIRKFSLFKSKLEKLLNLKIFDAGIDTPQNEDENNFQNMPSIF